MAKKLGAWRTQKTIARSAKRALEETEKETLARLAKTPRMVAFPIADEHVEGQGYRIGFAVEGEGGYRPTGTWPYHGEPGEVRPWFWGPTFTAAQKACDDYNAGAGIPKEEAILIVAGTMRGSR